MNTRKRGGHFDAAEVSPVPAPGSGDLPDEPYEGIYAMPLFMTLPSNDLEDSVDFWTRGLGFGVIYTMPGTMTHLRRWAFQDVLLVRKPGTVPADSIGKLSIAVTRDQIGGMVEACERLLPGSTRKPRRVPWNSLEAAIRTPEGLKVTLTAALPADQDQARRYLQVLGRGMYGEGVPETGGSC
ncbi:VOC family protein [Bifidobacterium indicum]|uniref:VOC family protein n=1 Tax=Bifidobacterium indicum TaxID=1691 RepID=UPI002627B469|nr:VOC family protein [uncultured Bifidobacterium sp.]